MLCLILRAPGVLQVLLELQDKEDQQVILDPVDQLVPKEMQDQLEKLEHQDSVEQKEIRFVMCYYCTPVFVYVHT